MITFSTAKNGEKTCEIDGKHLQSAYNPSREAEQFVLRLNAGFLPDVIILIEPGLSYCASFLRKRFPQTQLCAVRLSNDFYAQDNLWDYCLPADEHLADKLFDALGEEKLCSALFFSWPPAEQVFALEVSKAWQAIKQAVLKSRDVLATRTYFAKRWIKNAVLFCNHVQRTDILKKGECAIVVAASGPSLRTSLPKISAYRNRFFLIAVSSALLPLMNHNIVPDLVISTDGGFWAKKHLSVSGQDFTNIPFAIATEGACPTEILEKNTVIPLYYADGIEKKFLDQCEITAMEAQRNGTVSGTAAQFALALTSGNVYFCGLDLALAKGFQHTQPNALEIQNAAKDNRVRTKETRTASSECASQGSLEIYRNWFIAESPKLANRLYRLSDHYPYSNTLGQIQDITWESFAQKQPHEAKQKPSLVPCAKKADDTPSRLATAINTISQSAYFTKELCPVEVMLKKRALTETESAEHEKTIAKKTTAFCEELQGLLHD